VLFRRYPLACSTEGVDDIAGTARDSRRAGLTSDQAARRLAADGRNVLPTVARPSLLRRFLGELVHFFALMLWVAGVLAIVGGMPQLGVAIFAVIIVNAVFSFAQANRADRAAERLRNLLPARVTVRRDGRPQTIDSAEVVRDDLLLVEAGDRIPADAAVAVAHALLLDTSLLTGESRPTTVEVGDTVHAGTFVVEGSGEAVVSAVGADSRLAGIAHLTTATKKPATPLTIGLAQVVRLIAVIAVAVGLFFFGISLLLGNSAGEGFVFAIGVTVALVPEALLPTVTLSLAWGAEQMAKKNVLVRELEAVETLGSTTFICTDKTGTLTMNQMTVVEAWSAGGSVRVNGSGYGPVAELTVDGDREALAALALAAARCSTGYAYAKDGTWLAHGDPMEAAPDGVLPLCAAVEAEAGAAAVAQMTARGLRVLAVARRRDGAAARTAAELEHDLHLLGVIGLQDPPRPDVRASIDACRRAGVRIGMVTGDHPDTAAAIATEVGLRAADGPVYVGADLPADDGELGELLDHDGVVIARVAPEDKLRIARSLRARGHVVAMTGDGVNDAPALHEADIGVAMGASGTDVAREAADLVLLDDHFASIVAGIEQGRATYVNLRRFLTYHLTDNVAELTPFVVWVVSGGRFPLALGVLQILALDIGTDTLSAVALGAEPPSRHIIDGPPVGGRLMDRTVVRRAFGLLGPTVALMTMVAFVVSLLAAGWGVGQPWPDDHGIAAASGAAFLTVVLAQTANAWACRSSTRTPRRLGWTTNKLLPVTAAIEVCFALVVVFVGPIADRLGHAPPPLWGWVVGLAAMPLVLAVDALDKYRRVGCASRRGIH